MFLKEARISQVKKDVSRFSLEGVAWCQDGVRYPVLSGWKLSIEGRQITDGGYEWGAVGDVAGYSWVALSCGVLGAVG